MKNLKVLSLIFAGLMAASVVPAYGMQGGDAEDQQAGGGVDRVIDEEINADGIIDPTIATSITALQLEIQRRAKAVRDAATGVNNNFTRNIDRRIIEIVRSQEQVKQKLITLYNRVREATTNVGEEVVRVQPSRCSRLCGCLTPSGKTLCYLAFVGNVIGLGFVCLAANTAIGGFKI